MKTTKTKIEKICLQCKQFFIVKNYRPSTVEKVKYCSNKCLMHSTHIARKGVTISDEVKRKMSVAKLKTQALLKCIYCMKEFIVPQARALDALYCNYECYWKSKKGKKLSIEHRLKMAENMPKGEGHYLWKGGQEESHKIRASIEYRLWREAVFARDNFTCQICGQRGGKLQADHIKQFALFPELRLAIDNGRTLCVPCHKTTPNYGLKGIKKCN